MNITPSANGYVAELTDEDRATLVWVLEVGRALLLRDPSLSVLATERTVNPTLLDDLADALFLVGCARLASE